MRDCKAGQSALRYGEKSILISFHFAWCLLLKSSNSPLTNQGVESSSAGRRACVLLLQSPPVSGICCRWKEVVAREGWSVCKQGGQQHPWDVERGKESMLLGQKEEGEAQKGRGVSCISPVLTSEGTQGPMLTQETLPHHILWSVASLSYNFTRKI